MFVPRLAGAIAGALLIAPSAQLQRATPEIPMLVGTEWVAARLAEPGLVLLHVGDRKSYESAHLPGARLIGFDEISTNSRHEDGGLALELPPAALLRSRLEALGISDESRIVVYFAGDWVTPATRVVFTLDHLGLGAQTALLDGGLARWKREGRPVTSEVKPVARGRLTERPVRSSVVDAAFVQAKGNSSGYRIIDARAPVFYSGPRHGAHRAGHVPGAGSLPFSSIFDDSLRVLPRDSLERLFAGAGAQKGDTLLAYCHIGQQATAVVFAARLLGRPVRLYDGSFQDWSARTELPVETAAQGARAP